MESGITYLYMQYKIMALLQEMTLLYLDGGNDKKALRRRMYKWQQDLDRWLSTLSSHESETSQDCPAYLLMVCTCATLIRFDVLKRYNIVPGLEVDSDPIVQLQVQINGLTEDVYLDSDHHKHNEC